jgi:LPXTG-site transpeptidase (sortase) family protein
MTSYKSRRKLLFGAIIILCISLFGLWFYKDFLLPTSISRVSAPQRVSMESVDKNNPPNDNEVRSYTVPPTHPRRLIISSIGVNALIKPVGVVKDGALGAPNTAWDVGWYEDGGLPGQSGAMLVDGHVNDSYNTPGVFARLKNMENGDRLTVERGDGAMLSYQVVTVEQKPVGSVDMKRLLRPIEGSEGLNLITCGGTYDKKSGTYNDRIIVFATRI